MGDEANCLYDFAYVRKAVLLALQQFWSRDSYLLKTRLHEAAIAHRLALYLDRSFPSWDVDCEYNKYGEFAKMSSSMKRSKRLDIVVHSRGRQGPNLLAAEVKKRSRIVTSDSDRISRCVGFPLMYRWGVCISLSSTGVNLEWQGNSLLHKKPEKISWLDLEEMVRAN